MMESKSVTFEHFFGERVFAVGLLFAVAIGAWGLGLWPFKIANFGDALQYAETPMTGAPYASYKCDLGMGIHGDKVVISSMNVYTLKTVSEQVPAIGMGIRQYKNSVKSAVAVVLMKNDCR